MKFADIPQFPRSYYQVDVELKSIPSTLERWDERTSGSPLILNPEWQRGHVWTEKQQIAYMEYFLKGGTTGRDIYFNCSSWQGAYNTPIYCLDGLQRLTAATKFIHNEIPAFGHYFNEYTDPLRCGSMKFHMLKIRNKRELLTIYLDFNAAGTIHSKEELDRVTKMVYDTPETETL